MRALLAGARRKQPAFLELTRKLVLAESPSDNKAAVDACIAIAAARARELGGRVKLHRQRAYGDLLEARFGARSRRSVSQRVLLLGHLDTVWPLGTLKKMPCHIKDGRLFGPGAFDMKAGAAMAFTALEMLIESGLPEGDKEIILLLNTEEEIGSPVSRPITENLARECSAVYVFEPALGTACKTARKGTGIWRIEVQGVAAHAGVDFGKGASAIRELAHVVETVSNWTDLKRGLTVNVGLVSGGSATNVVPAHASADIDVRIARRADGPRIERLFANLKPSDRRCKLTVSGGLNRPPMERSRGTVTLFVQARDFAADIGFTLDEAATGGASDGNFTAALGIPTLDGLGAVGEGAHAPHESVIIEHLAPRTALLAALLAN
jgi:glutamate carboxypeptidase